MSLSISTSSAGPASEGPAAVAASTKSGCTGLPFDAILDDQTNATSDNADPLAAAALFVAALPGAVDGSLPGAVDGSLPGAVDTTLPGAEGAPVTPPALDPLIGLLHAFAFNGKRLLDGPRDPGKDAASLTSITKDKPANEAAALLLLAAHNAVLRFESLTPAAGGPQESGPAAQSTAVAPDDQPPSPAILAATSAPIDDASNAGVSASTSTATPQSDLTTAVSDFLTTEAVQNAPADQARPPDAAPSRPPASPPGQQLADAIRFATSQSAFADQDKGFNQPSATLGFDRRSTRTAAPLIHVAEAAAFGSTLQTAAASSVAASVSLPNEDGVVSSIVQAMRLQMRDGVGTAVVHLEPDYLGAVSIALRVENGVVTASLHAENPQVRAWMAANEPMLRDSLAEQGLSLDRLLVTDERVGDDHSRGRQQPPEHKQPARQRPRRDEATTFEVIV